MSNRINHRLARRWGKRHTETCQTCALGALCKTMRPLTNKGK